MKKVNAILLFTALLIVCNVVYSRTIDPPYEVGTWSGFRTAAVSYVSDAAYLPNLYSIAIPMFNSYGYKLTMYQIPLWNPPWSSVQAAAAQGHEAGSLTMDHTDLSTLGEADTIWQLSESQAVINSYVPGNQCLTLAYPYCNKGPYHSIIAQYYIAGRTCSGQIVPATPSAFYQISSIIVGSAGINTTAGITAKDDAAAAAGGWVVFLVHAIDNDNGWSPLSSTILNESLQYLDARRNIFWVNTFLNVVKYIRERNDVSVSEISNTGASITLQVTDTLDDAIYNYPVTIRRPLPEGWLCAYVSQNGQPVEASVVEVASVKYIMFDVVPDGGDVVLSKGTYGDFTCNGIVEMNDLPAFLDFWLVDDCNETIGVDLGEDCIVNFHEFAVLVENWLQAI